MKKRKMIFVGVLAASLVCVAAAFCTAVPLGICALVAAIPVVYLGYKPLIPTPAPGWYLYNNHIKPRLCRHTAAVPNRTPGGYKPVTYEEFAADLYIAPDGCDDNNGTKEAPFATFDRAKRAVRELDKRGRTGITVAVKAGTYAISGITFAREDGGTEDCPVCYKAWGGEVILNGGVMLDPERFAPAADPQMLERLPEAARRKVVEADLAAMGLTEQQIGHICAIGAFHTASQYSGDWIGPQFCELFVNGRRQTLARWPNTGFARTGRVIFSYGGSETEQTGTFSPRWAQMIDPPSDVFRVDRQTAKRIGAWRSTEDVWMFGYWMYDWADASTPIGEYDARKRTVSPKFVSKWGVKKGAPYYFFNIPEELDAPGEWYIDRRSQKLYLYPDAPLEQAQICLSVTCVPVLSVLGASHLSFDGFTLQGTRSDAVTVKGDYVTVQNCTVKNVAGNAIVMDGIGCRVQNCHISHVGKGGILLSGGDRETLVPGGCIAENNRIHSWSQIHRTYCPAVLLDGVGNICRQNEMYDSPHEVIWYHGNDHMIEENHIHHACLLTKDGGAIYAGKDWSYYGCVVRNNVIHDLGTSYYTACGIYMDDAVSGSSIYGNLLVNIPGIAIQLGGGRDLEVRDNIIVNCTNTPISYDDRAREGALFGGWFHYCSEPGGLMWQKLRRTAYRSAVWQEHYPQIAAFREDFTQREHPDFVPNPGRSRVCGNRIADPGPLHGNIFCRELKQYGYVANNRFCSLKNAEKWFADPQEGDYRLHPEE